MSGKNWVTLLAVGGLGLLVGAVIGRQVGVIVVQQEPPIQPVEESAQRTNILTLYRGNAEATDIETRLAIALSTDLSQDVALAELAMVISQLEFCGLPIEVTGIEGETATINLTEHPWSEDLNSSAPLSDCAGASWQATYFQGSAGGLITSKTLTYTLLQPELPGEWIEGVTFQYEGQPIGVDDWDHLPLSGVITRENLP